jgi:tetratricopeptide (TPR) repeat protein
MGKADKLIKEAQKAEKEGKFPLAFNTYLAASKEDASNKEIFVAMGRICLKEKLDMNHALEYLMKAVELDGNDPLVWEYLAETLAGLKRWAQAAKAYDKAISITLPKSNDIYMKMAEAYEFAQQPAQAIQSYQRLLKIDAKYIEAWNRMARVSVEMGKWDLAKEAAEKVLELDPNNYNAQNLLGITLNFMGDYPKAENVFKAAISAKPRVAMGWEKMAELYMNMERKSEALYCYQKAGEFGDIEGIQMGKELQNKGVQPKKPSVIDFL